MGDKVSCWHLPSIRDMSDKVSCWHLTSIQEVWVTKLAVDIWPVFKRYGSYTFPGPFLVHDLSPGLLLDYHDGCH
jgi:hypothetical protein